MRRFFLSAGLMLALLGCQDNTNAPNHNPPPQSESTQIVNNQAILNIDDIIKTHEIQFRKTTGHYPLLIDDTYQSVNQTIQSTIDELLVFDNGFSGDAAEGVDKLEYSVINFDDNQLSFQIEYNTQDMTSRYFIKYYQLDLKNKQAQLLPEYLNKKQIDIEKLNTAINDYLKPCLAETATLDYCQNLALSQLGNRYDFDTTKINLINDYDSFYIQDDNTIVVAINSNQYTASFTINLAEYQIMVN